MTAIVAFLAAYLVGSLDFGVLVPKVLGTDIYAVGSGNPGVSNVLRTMGKGPAAIVLLGDGAKGAIAAAIGGIWLGETVAFACAFAAVLGHVAPIWHRFRGGRGVATAIGSAIYLEPVVGLILAVLWLAIVLVWKKASLGSLTAMVLFVPGFAVSGHTTVQLLWATAIAALVIVRHAGNIRRIVSGEEREVGIA